MTHARLKIAVLDDEAPVRQALRRLFRSAGMDVEVFSSGRDFLDSLQTRCPDCLVLDLHLPGMTGRDVQLSLVQRQLRLPMVVVTGRDEPGMRETVLAAGAAAYLLKPVDDSMLLLAVTAASRPPLRRPEESGDSS